MIKKNIQLITLAIILAATLLISCGKDDCEEEMNNCTEQSWYEDADGDGFGNADITQLSCDSPEGFVSDNTDFNDTDATSFPNAEEICDDGIDNNGNDQIDECLFTEIIGIWNDEFGMTLTISNSSISYGNESSFNILATGQNYVICENDESNLFNPGQFSKFVFTNIMPDEMYLCQSFFNADSQEYIEMMVEPSDSTNLTSGCGGFQWSLLIRQ